jgi:hypothetical protein
LVLIDARKCKHCGCALVPLDPTLVACGSCTTVCRKSDINCTRCGFKLV